MTGEHPKALEVPTADELVKRLRVEHSHGLSDDAANLIEAMQKRLAQINTIACYVTEEDPDSRYQGLIEIGKLARGEEVQPWPTL